MSSTSRTEIINDVFDNTPTAGTTSIRETVEYLDSKGLLGGATKVSPGEIKKGDWIAYFLGDDPDELYEASCDGDTNLNTYGPAGEFFRVSRALFGKARPVIKVKDIEPGVRFDANFLGRPRASFVRLTGLGVLQVSGGRAIRWSAINGDFTDIEIID